MEHPTPSQTPYRPEDPIQPGGMTTRAKIAIAAVLGMVGIGLIAGYAVLQFMHAVKNDTAGKYEPEVVVEEEPVATTTVDDMYEEKSIWSSPTEEGVDPIYGAYVRYENEPIRHFTNLFAEEALSIEWNDAAVPVKNADEIMKKIDEKYPTSMKDTKIVYDLCETCKVYLYEAGSVTAPARFAGAAVYYVFFPYEGMGPGHIHTLALYSEETNQFIVLDDLEGEPQSFRYLYNEELDWFAGLVRTDLSEIYQYPEEIFLPNKDLTIYHKMRYRGVNQEGIFNSFFEEGWGGIDNVKEFRVAAPPTEEELVYTHPEYGGVYYSGSYFYIILPNGTRHLYDLEPDFYIQDTPEEAVKSMYNPGYKTNIRWTFNDAPARMSEDRFSAGGMLGPYGCGRNYIPLTSVVGNADWFDEALLNKIGETQTGDTVYEMTNQEENAYYQDLFEYGFSTAMWQDFRKIEEAEEKYTEEERFQMFMDDHPVFFWKDPMGEWRVFQKAKYQPIAECGKPVIYLYPEEATKVNVQVSPNGGFTVTDPMYPSGGWDVVAHPDGQLEYPADGKTYPYLFWEGHANGFPFPEQGFVFAKDDVGTHMRELLYKTGLNKQETEDFMEFWEEKMTVSPYVFVTFADQRYFEEAAPLAVTPTPDTTIRVMMNFESLEQWKDVAPLHIRTPERNGFTVVEWGGVLQ